MNAEIFREYDIRGAADRDFPDPVVRRIGRAVATRLRRWGRVRVTVGRDARPSSLRIMENLAEGLATGGLEVLELGVCPTPVLYWSTVRYGAHAGVMVTGSHNPPEDNGIKILSGGANWYGRDLVELRSICEAGDFVSGPGSRHRLDAANADAILSRYLEDVVDDFAAAGAGPPSGILHVAVDAGNGVAGLTAPALYRRLGFRVTELFCEVDGSFPNHHPDPVVDSNLAALVAAVRDLKCDLGIAFDGDGDRIGVVDERGGIVRADDLLILFGRDLLRLHPGGTIIADVKCSRRLFQDLQARGAQVLMWKTGHSLIKAKMRQERAILAGELAGHLCFGDRFCGFDDAVYAGARLLALLAGCGQPVGRLLADLPPVYSTPEIRVSCPEHRKLHVVKQVRDIFAARIPVVDLDGVRLEFEDGWGLLRASNTQAALTLRFEAESESRLQQIRSLVMETLEPLMQENREGSKS